VAARKLTTASSSLERTTLNKQPLVESLEKGFLARRYPFTDAAKKRHPQKSCRWACGQC